MKKYLIIIFFLMFSNNLYSADIKIAFIDMDFIFKNSLAGKSINKQIDEINDKSIKKLKKMEDEIKKDDENIVSQKNILSEEEIKSKVSDLNKKLKEYQKERQNLNNLINKEKINATSKLLENLKPILSDYSRENSISLVLEKKNIIIGKNNLNITEEIISLLDQKIKKINIK